MLWGLVLLYAGILVTATLGLRGRALQEWVIMIVPSGRIREILLYPLQHHHPIVFAKVILFGDILVNIFLFLPVGVIIFLVLDRVFLYSGRITCCIVVAVGAGFSLCIELTQYMIPKRIPSAADVLANAAGALLGALLCSGRQRLRKRLTASPDSAATSNGKVCRGHKLQSGSDSSV